MGFFKGGVGGGTLNYLWNFLWGGEDGIIHPSVLSVTGTFAVVQFEFPEF